MVIRICGIRHDWSLLLRVIWTAIASNALYSAESSSPPMMFAISWHTMQCLIDALPAFLAPRSPRTPRIQRCQQRHVILSSLHKYLQFDNHNVHILCVDSRIKRETKKKHMKMRDASTRNHSVFPFDILQRQWEAVDTIEYYLRVDTYVFLSFLAFARGSSGKA